MARIAVFRFVAGAAGFGVTAACSGATDVGATRQAVYYRQDDYGAQAPYRRQDGFHAGDLLLRPDDTYVFTRINSVRVEGRWAASGTALTLTPASSYGASSLRGTITADSILLDFGTPLRLLRGELTGSALAAGVYVLRSINGQRPDTGGFVTSDVTYPGFLRAITRTRYDTLFFTDGVLLQQARGTSYTSVYPASPSITTTDGFRAAGAYNATAAAAVLFPQTVGVGPAVGPSVALSVFDTLAVRGDTLVRAGSGAFANQRYVRVR